MKNTTNSKAALWAAVQALMQERYGKDNLFQLAKDVPVGLGSASRLKAQGTSVGVDLIDKLADHFGLQPWQMLVPAFDAKLPPMLADASPMGLDLAKLLDAIPDETQRRRAYALCVQLIQFSEVPNASEPATPQSEPQPTRKPARSR